MPDPAGVASRCSRHRGRTLGRSATPPPAAERLAARGRPDGDRAAVDAVQVWSERLDAPAPRGDAVEWLDDDERARAGRFRFERDRRRFVARRAFLRAVLAGALDIAPADIRYRTSGTTRPELEAVYDLSFSTSHSGDLAVVAVSRERIVGVDIGVVRPIPDAQDLAAAFFTAREHEVLEATPIEGRSTAFLRLWTRKEAYAKAVGLGMTLPFQDFEVLDGDAGGPPVVAPLGAGRPFVLSGLDDLPGYVGTVATSIGMPS